MNAKKTGSESAGINRLFRWPVVYGSGSVVSIVTAAVAFWGMSPTLLGIGFWLTAGVLIGVLCGVFVRENVSPVKNSLILPILVSTALAWLVTVAAVLSFSLIFFAAPDEIYNLLFNRK